MQYSIVSFNEVNKESNAARLDAEFFSPSAFEAVKLIKNKPYKAIVDILLDLTDYHANGSYEILREHVSMSDTKDYALMIRAVDFENNDFENNVKYVTEKAYNFLKKTKLHGDEVIINKIGNAGNVYIMPKLEIPVTLGMNLFMLRFTKEFLPHFIYVYLSTCYGNKIIKRRVTGAVPLSIDKESVREIIVPDFKFSFQEKIANIITYKENLEKICKLKYDEAENFLLYLFNLESKTIGFHKSYIKNFSDTQNTNRLDAEYFQPKYDELIKKIKSYPNGWNILDNVVFIKKGVEIGSEAYVGEGCPFVRVSNLNKFGLTNNNQQYLSKELYEELKAKYQPKKNEIILSKDGTPGIAYLLSEEPEKMILSGGLLRLELKNTKDYLPEYLTLVLNSILVQQQIEQKISGALIQHWLIDDIKATIIPKLEKNKQQDLVDKIKEATLARTQSKQLLEIAKHGVEKAIEKNEDVALQWIGEQLKQIGVTL